MSFTDKSLQCTDCGETFTFTSTEQEFFASKGYANDPKRCDSCRLVRKKENGSGNGGNNSGSGYSGGGGYSSGRRQMYPAVCATCKTSTQVPFEPRQDRPVYCSQCYNKQGSSSYSRR